MEKGCSSNRYLFELSENCKIVYVHFASSTEIIESLVSVALLFVYMIIDVMVSRFRVNLCQVSTLFLLPEHFWKVCNPDR